MNFSSQIFFNNIHHGYKSTLLKKSSSRLHSIYMDSSSNCYNEKRRRTNWRSLSIFILFQLQCWIILRVTTKFLFGNFHAKRVILEIAMMNSFNNCITGSLNNNYFPLNESSSLYYQCFIYSITAWKNTYLKNYSITSNALILKRYSYPKQVTYCTRFIKLTKYTVLCNRLLMYTFYFPDFECTWRQ